MSKFDTVIVRSNILAEVWASMFLENYGIVNETIETTQQTSMTAEQLQRIRGKRVLIIGGYYRGNYAPITDIARETTSILQQEDESYPSDNVLIGSISEIISKFVMDRDGADVLKDGNLMRVMVLLDGYLAGEFTEENMSFQAGIYNLAGATHRERLKTLQGMSFQYVIDAGKDLRVPLQRTADERAKASIAIQYNFNNTKISIQCAPGGTPIVESCIALAALSGNGVGMLVRHNYKDDRTLISLYSNTAAVNAAELAKSLIGGGGSAHMAGGSCAGLLTAQQIIISATLRAQQLYNSVVAASVATEK